MNIVVFVKQVPDTNDVKWTENNNIDRTNMESVINPADRQALEAALILKDRYGATISAIAMGPAKAVEVLKEAIAMGVDDAFLLCDSKFAGSDTCATSKVLAAAVKEKLPQTDLILFGQTAIDGETGQTGPSTATRLGLTSISNVIEIIEINEKSIIVNTETEKEKITLKTELPCALCINNYVFKPRVPRINGYIKAQDYDYKSYNIYDLNLTTDDAGVKGSPTYVSKVFKNKEGRNCKLLNYEDEGCIESLKKEILEQ
ncbi:electron transfer flavoprotein subunit beta/FixA family protein [bacterium]|nr:electron transfer flavoprotein subunit beta/FixA family protein [bacterium]